LERQLKKFNIIFDDQGALVYVDLLSGIPTFWEIAIDAKISDKIRTNTMKIKFLANTVFKKTKPENTHSTNDIQSRLSKLKKLLDAGLITKKEAATKRKAILDSL
jgi:adenylate cyclase class IV